LLSGKVRELMESAITLSADDLRSGHILACQSIPKTSVELEVAGLADMPDNPMVEVGAQIVRQTPLTHDIVEIELSLDDEMHYTAGQYADFHVPGVQTPRSYSFARSPERADSTTANFFIRKVPDGEFTEWLFAEPRVGCAVRVQGPLGNLWLRPSEIPVLCVAGGSGLAPVKAILESAHDNDIDREFHLVFGARTQEDLYALESLRDLSRGSRMTLDTVVVLSDEGVDSGWHGARGLVTDAIAGIEPAVLETCDAYVCGPPAMVDAVEEQLCTLRKDTGFFHADRFLDKSSKMRSF
jgi:NAD(P)H-flavin reductase